MVHEIGYSREIIHRGEGRYYTYLLKTGLQDVEHRLKQTTVATNNKVTASTFFFNMVR